MAYSFARRVFCVKIHFVRVRAFVPVGEEKTQPGFGIVTPRSLHFTIQAGCQALRPLTSRSLFKP